MSEQPTPREVIAHIVDMGSNDADAILAALTAAGYTICVQKFHQTENGPYADVHTLEFVPVVSEAPR